ncbi:SCO3242 family prenyltransferase [Amycolatopsis sp. NPDC059021]|uniref:SCO3242 family prenyltransferase n=1 Tax=Amycolatopsis sp. NPDC059021 TaxID=3346704 RepID=UPI00366E04E4
MRALAELVRAPAALTVPGDALAGAAAAGWPFGRRTLPLSVASVLLYWAGMALNDYADRAVDATERPERPIPSGRVSPAAALGLAIGLTGGGIGVAAVTGGVRALRVAVPLAATVWAYDLLLKATSWGPVTMAAARALDVLLGAGGARVAVSPALIVGVHTLAVTVVSRSEVDGAKPVVPAAALTATVGAGLATCLGGTANPVTTSAFAGTYAVTTGRALCDAVRDPSAPRVRHAVGTGISGMIPLQAGLIVRTGARRAALGVAAAFPLARLLGRKVSPT